MLSVSEKGHDILINNIRTQFRKLRRHLSAKRFRRTGDITLETIPEKENRYHVL